MVAREALQDLPSPPPAFVAFAQAWQAWQALRCPCGGALPTTFVRPTLLPTILPCLAYNPFADMLGGQDQDTIMLRVTQTRHVSHSVSTQNKQAAEEKTCWSLSLTGQRNETQALVLRECLMVMDKANIAFRKPLERFLRPFGEVSTKTHILPYSGQCMIN